jgi:hypothetical protein
VIAELKDSAWCHACEAETTSVEQEVGKEHPRPRRT